MPTEKVQEDVFKHVVVIDTHNDSAGKPSTNPTVQCVHCDKKFRGGSTRIRGHLAHTQGCGVAFCEKVPAETKGFFEQLQKGKQEEKLKKRKLAALDKLTRSNSAPVEPQAQATLPSAFSKCTKAQTDAAVGRFFYAEGVAFKKIESLESPYFAEMCQAIGKFGASYKPPTRRRLAVDLLDTEFKAVEDQLQHYMSTLAQHSRTVTSDGWQDVRAHPLLNILIVTCKGSCFIKSVNTSGETKVAHLGCICFCSRHMILFHSKSSTVEYAECDAIESIGPANVIQIVTDSAANCVKAGGLVEERYLGCVVAIRLVEGKFLHIRGTECSMLSAGFHTSPGLPAQLIALICCWRTLAS